MLAGGRMSRNLITAGALERLAELGPRSAASRPRVRGAARAHPGDWAGLQEGDIRVVFSESNASHLQVFRVI